MGRKLGEQGRREPNNEDTTEKGKGGLINMERGEKKQSTVCFCWSLFFRCVSFFCVLALVVGCRACFVGIQRWKSKIHSPKRFDFWFSSHFRPKREGETTFVRPAKKTQVAEAFFNKFKERKDRSSFFTQFFDLPLRHRR